MSYELYVPATSGSTIYAVITRADGKYANGTTPETYNASNWTSYAVAMTETGVIGDFYATMPALPAGLYRFAAYIRSGGSPATSDVKCWVSDLLQYWDGAAFVSSAQVITGIAGTINQQTPATAATIQLDADGFALVRNADGDDLPSASDVTSIATDLTTAATAITGISSTVDAIQASVGGIVGNGDGDVLVNHNYGGTDALRFVVGGAGIDGVTIRAYEAADYAAGTYTVIAQAITGSDGRWVVPLMLDAGDYILVYSKPEVIQTVTKALTVS